MLTVYCPGRVLVVVCTVTFVPASHALIVGLSKTTLGRPVTLVGVTRELSVISS